MSARSGRLPAAAGEGLRWIPPDGLHLTLRFLGQAPRSLIPDIRAAVAASAAATTPFRLGLGRLSWFGNGRSGVLAAAVRSEGELDELHGRLESAFDGLGFEPDRRPFGPHLTIARPRGRRRPDRLALGAVADALVGLTWLADAVVLFESHLGPDGARHEPLEVGRLGRPPIWMGADGTIGDAPGQRPTAPDRGTQSTCRSPSERASSPPSDSST